MTFLAPLPWWLLAALAAAAVVWAWLAVGLGRARLGAQRAAILAGTRVVVVLLLIGILMRPVVMGLPPDAARATVALLVDGSRSMGLADAGTTSRFARALTLVRETIGPALQSRFAVRSFVFGDSLRPVGETVPDPDAPLADLDGALRALPSAVGSGRLAGVVVVSDGGMTATPTTVQGRLGVPVVAVGVGATDGYRDREVLEVSMGDVAFAESTVAISAIVASRGLGDRSLDVTVLADGTPVAAGRVALAGSGVPARFAAEVRPASDRAVRFTVRLATAAGELTTANNQASVLAPPARRQARVLLVEGAPGFEHSFLKRALERDSALSVDAVVPKGRSDRGDPAYYVQAGAERARDLVEGWPSSRPALFLYDAVVLANASLRSLSRRQLDQLTEFVSRRGGGLVAIGADTVDADVVRAAPFAQVLPIDPLGRAAIAPRALRAARRPGAVWLTPDGEGHPVMRPPGEGSEAAIKWSDMPPLSASPVAGHPRPGASVLAMVAGPGGDPQPLVTVQRYGRGRVLAFTGEASWRWRMMRPSEDQSYETFWRQAVRWVAATAPGHVDVAAWELPGGTAGVAVDVRDADFEPAPDAVVPVLVTEPSGRTVEVRARRDPLHPSRFDAAFDARAAGVYRVRVEPHRGGDPLPAADAWLLAGAFDREARDPRRNDEALHRMAEARGGQLVDESGLASLARLFDPGVEGERRAPVDLWHNWWMLTLLLTLLCVEWALRRRWGLR